MLKFSLSWTDVVYACTYVNLYIQVVWIFTYEDYYKVVECLVIVKFSWSQNKPSNLNYYLTLSMIALFWPLIIVDDFLQYETNNLLLVGGYISFAIVEQLSTMIYIYRHERIREPDNHGYD